MIQRIRARKKDLQREARHTLRIGIPVIIAQLLQMSMNFVDTVMAGNLSAQTLAAVAVGGAMLMPFIMFSSGILSAITPITAQLFGARESLEIGRNARQCLWLALILSVPTFFILRNLEPLMALMDISPDLIPTAGQYLDAISWGLTPFFLYMALRFFNEGLSVTRPSMVIALAGLLVNIPANYILMYGKLGFPPLGAAGCGYATSIVGLVMVLLMALFTTSYRPFRRFEIFSHIRKPEWNYLKEILRIGVPIGVSTTMEVTMFAVVSLLMASISTLAVAGHQVAINFAAIMFMVPLGLSTAITTRVGNAVGEKSVGAVRIRGFVGVSLCALFMICTATVMFLYPDLIVSIYTQDPAVKEVAVSLIYLAAVFQISDGLQVGGFGALRGLKDTKVPMYVNLVAYWIVGLPVGYYLGMIKGWGPEGLWYGLIAGLTITAVLHNSRFVLLTKQSN
ncbi:MAG: MATE family efflux transporter [Balneolaceae bacterium]|nr:MATE family efflux transporter [Balneolaceae bacterium]